MNLRTDPWIPTTHGLLSLEDTLSRADQLQLASSRPTEEYAILRLLLVCQARGLKGHFNLFGTHPFMQTPAQVTEELPDTPLTALRLTEATGRDTTLLSRTFDSAPKLWTYAEAARILLAFHQFAPSRGKSAWNQYTKDGPLARSVLFHAQGRTLADTLRLNAVPELASTPAPWEGERDPQPWRENKAHPLDVTGVHAFAWRGVTLIPEENGVRRAKVFAGRIPEHEEGQPWPDPHTLPTTVKNAKGEMVPSRLRSPDSRELMSALARTVQQMLTGGPGPLSFTRALAEGSGELHAFGLITRTGQPVIDTLTRAALHVPQVDTEHAVTLLDMALNGEERLKSAAIARWMERGVSLKDAGKRVRDSFPFAQYWRTIWPALGEALQGQCDDFENVTDEAVKSVLNAQVPSQRDPLIDEKKHQRERSGPPVRRESGRLRDQDFTTTLLQSSRSILQDRHDLNPPKATRRLQASLLGDATGGEAQARRLMMDVYADHGLSGPDSLMHVLAHASRRGLFSDQYADVLKGIHRARLGDALRPIMRLLADHQLPFDYHALYLDLIYHTPELAARWEAEYQEALTPAPQEATA